MNLKQLSHEVLKRKLSKMSRPQLEHAIQQFEDEAVHYQAATKNYTVEKQKNCSAPFLQGIREKIHMAQELLKQK